MCQTVPWARHGCFPQKMPSGAGSENQKLCGAPCLNFVVLKKRRSRKLRGTPRMILLAKCLYFFSSVPRHAFALLLPGLLGPRELRLLGHDGLSYLRAPSPPSPHPSGCGGSVGLPRRGLVLQLAKAGNQGGTYLQLTQSHKGTDGKECFTS